MWKSIPTIGRQITNVRVMMFQSKWGKVGKKKSPRPGYQLPSGNLSLLLSHFSRLLHFRFKHLAKCRSRCNMVLMPVLVTAHILVKTAKIIKGQIMLVMLECRSHAFAHLNCDLSTNALRRQFQLVASLSPLTTKLYEAAW